MSVRLDLRKNLGMENTKMIVFVVLFLEILDGEESQVKELLDEQCVSKALVEHLKLLM